MTQPTQGIQSIDEHPTFSNQQTVAHDPDRFIIDFKTIFPQFTPENEATVVINHRVVFLTPHVAKEFLAVLEENISRYEKTFGKIEKPAAVLKAEKNMQAQHKASGTEKPSYLG